MISAASRFVSHTNLKHAQTYTIELSSKATQKKIPCAGHVHTALDTLTITRRWGANKIINSTQLPGRAFGKADVRNKLNFLSTLQQLRATVVTAAAAMCAASNRCSLHPGVAAFESCPVTSCPCNLLATSRLRIRTTLVVTKRTVGGRETQRITLSDETSDRTLSRPVPWPTSRTVRRGPCQ